ncbi:ATP-binding cassette domain-containing protein [Natronobeatus ordinarius]|uniref:ATP-binding cassette domain-containing protein n=1 Tax=Natronobeatus ordinarius TaxID=2963433 RepID=UPI0020CDCB5C|nr:ATP-binding cassette domain-containing protein [Natronobeatus ordinarius]
MATADPFNVDPRRREGADSSSDGGDEGGGDGLPIGLTLLAGAVSAVIVIPVLWVGVVALSVEYERAAAIVFRARTLEILLNTLALVVVVTTLSVLIAVPLAFLTTLTNLPYRRLWIVALSLPLVVPSFTSAFAFISVWGPRGLVQSLVEPFGVESLPSIYGFWGTAFILTLYNYPFVYITTLAGLQAFDKTYLDAARTLETGLWPVFKRVVFPLAKPAIAAGALLTALETAGDFGVPALLRLDVLTRQIYVEHNALAHDYAAMLSLHLVAITLVILAIESQVRGHETIHGGSRGESRSYTIRLGRWKWPVLLGCGMLFTLSIVLPIVFLTWWLIQGPQTYVASLEFSPEYAFNSASVSVLAALVAAAFALPVAVLAARYRSTVSTLLERATYVGFAVPGVVIGLSLVYFGSAYLPALYQTIPLLVFAYVVLYLPLAVGSVRASILYVNPHLTEAARSLGCSPREAFRKITLPLILPGVVAGAALVFLHGMKELPATLLLRPTGFETLASFIWVAERNAYYGYAAVPALVLIFVSGFAILAVLPGERFDYRRVRRRIGRSSPRLRSAKSLEGDRADVSFDGGRREDWSEGDDEADVPATRARATATAKADAETDPGDVILELEAVRKAFNGETAVDDCSLSVREGEVLTLLGPSGCGKTTTLRLIGGLDRPDAGTIRIHDRVVADDSSFVPAESRDVGIVFQDFALFPHRTVAENVAFGLEASSEAETTVDELLELVGLREYRDSYPDELSGGQKQRIALARSLAPQPELLLLDEPLSNLDAGLRVRMRTAIREILDAVDVTAIWVTHDQEEALSVGDRTAVMNAGSIEQLDTPRAAFMRPATRMVADFLGQASYLRGALENGVVETAIGPLERDHVLVPESADVGRLDVLVRPDDVALEEAAPSAAHGRIVDRQFTGSSVTYRVELEDGTTLHCRRPHEDWLDVSAPVRVSITAGHELPAFEVESESGARGG